MANFGDNDVRNIRRNFVTERCGRQLTHSLALGLGNNTSNFRESLISSRDREGARRNATGIPQCFESIHASLRSRLGTCANGSVDDFQDSERLVDFRADQDPFRDFLLALLFALYLGGGELGDLGSVR